MSGGKRILVLRIIGECKAGGTQTITLNYYENLDHEKVAMDFLFYGNILDHFRESLEKNGDHVISVTNYKKNVFKSIWEIKQIVRDGEYDIVHARLNTLNFFPLLGAYLGGAKIRIAANHSTANLRNEFIKSLVKYILKPTTKFMATHYAACSEFAGIWCFGRTAWNKGRIKLICNAIDLDKFRYSEAVRDKVRHECKWDKHFVVGYVGRFSGQKNYEFLVKIFSEIHEQCPCALLVLVGDGALVRKVRDQVYSLGLDDCVQFLGVRYDVDELMQGMDVFLFPSLYEGLGNVVTEAQAVGLKCVVSDVVPKEVALTELVEFMPLEKTAEQWAEVLLAYKDGYDRHGRGEQLARAGYEIKSAAKDLEEYYKSLLSFK